MQAPGGPEEDTSGNFKHGGWVAGYWDGVMEKVMGDQTRGSLDLLLGRKTYEIFAAYWPKAKEDPFADMLNKARKYVASTTLRRLDWNNSTLVKGDIPEEIRKLKRHDLIDEFWLKIFPVTIGHGKRLFGNDTIPASFKLLETKTSTTSVITANYRRDGEIRTATFDLDNQKRDLKTSKA